MILSFGDNRSTQAHRPNTKNFIFVFKGLQNVENSSKSLFLKFDPKTILPLPYMDNRKKLVKTKQLHNNKKVEINNIIPKERNFTVKVGT